MEKKYLTAEYMEFVEKRRDVSDKYRRIFNQLDRENVGSIISNGNYAYVEGYSTPKYIIDDIEKWVKSIGLTFFRCVS